MSVCIKQVFMSMLKKSWIVVLVTLLCAAAALGVSRFGMTEQYTASALVYVYNGEQRGQSAAVTNGDTLASKDIAKSASVMMKSEAVLSQAAYDAQLPFSIGQLEKMVRCDTVEDTEVVRICATVPDPEQARRLADAVAETAKNTLRVLSKGGEINIIDYAALPQAPSSPLTWKNTALAAFMGFFLSLLFLYVLEASNRKIRCRLDLNEQQQQMLIGQIAAPVMDPQLYKASCARLLFELARRNSRCVLFTGYDTGCPKAYSCANIAAAAGAGARVLVIEADPAAPQAQDLLYVQEGPGFFNALSGADLVQCVYPTQFAGVSVMPLGQAPQSFHYEGGVVTRLLEKLSEQFDYIFVNVPSLTENADLRYFADDASMVVLTVRAGVNTKEQLNTAVSMLKCPEDAALVLYRGKAAISLPEDSSIYSTEQSRRKQAAKR